MPTAKRVVRRNLNERRGWIVRYATRSGEILSERFDDKSSALSWADTINNVVDIKRAETPSPRFSDRDTRGVGKGPFSLIKVIDDGDGYADVILSTHRTVSAARAAYRRHLPNLRHQGDPRWGDEWRLKIRNSDGYNVALF